MHRSAALVLAFVLHACGGGDGASSDPQSETTTGQEAPRDAPAALLPVGIAAPDFAALDQTGAERTLAAERGHVVVLYFYPRDATPGCTAEACAFRDAWARYQEAGVRVLGVSVDDVASHLAFAQEHELPFPLLADTDATITDAYGVRATEEGVTYSRRVTYVIGPDGAILFVFDNVDPGVHADEVLAAIAER